MISFGFFRVLLDEHPWLLNPHKTQVAIVELPFDFVSDESHGGAGGTCVIRGCVPKKLLVYAYVWWTLSSRRLQGGDTQQLLAMYKSPESDSPSSVAVIHCTVIIPFHLSQVRVFGCVSWRGGFWLGCVAPPPRPSPPDCPKERGDSSPQWRLRQAARRRRS